MKIRILLSVSAVVATLSAVWLIAGRMHRFAYWIGRKSDAEVAALATDGWQVERLEVAGDGVGSAEANAATTTDKGPELVGLVRPPAAANARWILFVPGNSADLLRGFRAVLDELRGDEDVGLAVWAYRGFDASGGTPSPAALQRDLWPQHQRLIALGANPDKIEIWGYSLGSALAPHLAARLCEADMPPARLVLLATAEAIDVMPHGRLGRFGRSDVFAPLRGIEALACETVVAHGEQDQSLAIESARRVAEQLAARFVPLPGCGHADLWPSVRRLIWQP